MRNDVKLGFAIGGVLLAVVIVFALVNSSKAPEQPVDPTAAAMDTKPEANRPPVDMGNSTAAANTTTPPAAAATNTQTPSTPPANTTGATVSTASDTHTTTPATRDPWACLEDGKLPTLMSNQTTSTGTSMTTTPTRNLVGAGNTTPPETPSVATSNTPAALGGGVNDRTGGSARVTLPNLPHPQQDDADRVIREGTRATGTSLSQPTSAVLTTGATGTAVKAQSHTIKSGETFSTIATAYYGHLRYAKLIAKANPGVDSSHLKVGQVINLPAFDPKTDAVASTGAVTASPAIAMATVDSKTQYRVQKGDSLHAISMKLYGDAKHVDAIYQANKSTLPAPEKLKVDMVLNLPTPPTQK
jgi:nucleoid-associated protein YgaU